MSKKKKSPVRKGDKRKDPMYKGTGGSLPQIHEPENKNTPGGKGDRDTPPLTTDQTFTMPFKTVVSKGGKQKVKKGRRGQA